MPLMKVRCCFLVVVSAVSAIAIFCTIPWWMLNTAVLGPWCARYHRRQAEEVLQRLAAIRVVGVCSVCPPLGHAETDPPECCAGRRPGSGRDIRQHAGQG